MKYRASSLPAFRALGVVAALAFASLAQAQLQFQVQLNTSALVSNPAGPFSLDFQLNDGSGLGDGNNWAKLSNFQFGGGSAWGSATTFGGATGSLSSTVTLNDSNGLFNELYQSFTPGSWLSFTVSLSNWADAGPTPDKFSFAILDGAVMNLPTHSIGSDTFLEVNLTGGTPSILTYGSLDGAIAAPTVTPVPEASTYGIWAAALLGALALRQRRKRA